MCIVSHMVISVVLVKVGSTVKFNVARESHPAEVNLMSGEPAEVRPFQTNGSSVSHTVVSVIENNVLFTVKFNVVKLSHPVTVLVSVAV